MKWLVVFLIIVVAGMACGDVAGDTADGADSSPTDLEARVVRIEEALAPGLQPPWERPREGLIDVSTLEGRLAALEEYRYPPSYWPTIP